MDLPSLLFSALFTLPQAFSNDHWPKSAGEVKDCVSLAVPRPGGPRGTYVSVKVTIGLKARGSGVKGHRRSGQMLGSLSKSLNLCGLFERDHVNLV